MEEQGLIIVEKLNAVEVFTGPQGVEKILSEIEAKVNSFVPDVSTPTSRKAIASLAYKVSQSKTLLDSLGKELVSDWKKKSAMVDSSRKVARDRLDALRDKARQPLAEWEENEEKRLEALALAAEIEVAHTAAISENELFDRQKAIEAREAELARIEADRIAKEEAERAERRIKEEQARQKELEAQREKERQEAEAKRINEAEERAKREAEEARARAEVQHAEALRKAEEDKQRAVKEAEAKAQAEADRKERQRLEKEAAQRAEEKRLADEAAKKAADTEHRRKVNRAAVKGLMESSALTKEQAQNAVTSIVAGLVPHVNINY